MSTNPDERIVKRYYQGKDRDTDSQQAELDALIEERNKAIEDTIEEVDEGIEQIDQEEATFKKRYADLRRYSNKQLKEMKDKLSELEQKVATKPQVTIPEVPEDEEEFQQYVEQYPEAAKMIALVSAKEAKRATENLAAQVAALEAKEKAIAREAAILALTKIHPDWNQIEAEEEFWDWVESEDQPDWVSKAMEGIDYKSIARVIDLYKLDKGRITPKQETKKPKVDAAAAELSIKKVKPTEPRATEGKTWKESEVARLNIKQYQELEPEILKAISEGRFVNDISG